MLHRNVISLKITAIIGIVLICSKEYYSFVAALCIVKKKNDTSDLVLDTFVFVAANGLTIALLFALYKDERNWYKAAAFASLTPLLLAIGNLFIGVRDGQFEWDECLVKFELSEYERFYFGFLMSSLSLVVCTVLVVVFILLWKKTSTTFYPEKARIPSLLDTGTV